MSRFRRPSGVVALVAALALTGITGAAVAVPEPGPGGADLVTHGRAGPGVGPLAASDCPSGRLCLWSQGDHNGALWTIGKSKVVTDVGPAASPAWSAWNRSGSGARIFSGTGGTGSVTCLPSGWIGNLATGARSVQIVSSC